MSESVVLYKGPYEQSSFLAVETIEILRNIDYFSLDMQDKYRVRAQSQPAWVHADFRGPWPGCCLVVVVVEGPGTENSKIASKIK